MEFQEWFKEVSRIFQVVLAWFQGCLKKLEWVFEGGFQGVSRMFQGSFKGVLKKIEGSFLRMIQESFNVYVKEVKRMFQGSFKDILTLSPTAYQILWEGDISDPMLLYSICVFVY